MVFNNRKRYYIKKDFQFRFILRFVFIATVWAAATIILFAIMAGKRIEELRYSPHIAVKTAGEILLPSALNAHIISFLIFIGILTYSIHSLWRRLSSPLYSIKKDINRIAGGDLVNAVTLREDDEFQDLASDLDAMRGELQTKFARIKESHSGVSAAVAELNRALLKGGQSERETASLKKAVEQMKGDVNVFTV